MKLLGQFSLMFLACLLALIVFACITEEDEPEERVCSPVQEDLSSDQLRESYQMRHEKKN